MEEYPETAMLLTLIGAIIALIPGVVFSLIGFTMFYQGYYGEGIVCVSLSLIGAILGIIAALWMKNPEKVHAAGGIAIIAAFLSIFGVLSFLLMLIGGIMALTWEKPKKMAKVLPPQPPT